MIKFRIYSCTRIDCPGAKRAKIYFVRPAGVSEQVFRLAVKNYMVNEIATGRLDAVSANIYNENQKVQGFNWQYQLTLCPYGVWEKAETGTPLTAFKFVEKKNDPRMIELGD